MSGRLRHCFDRQERDDQDFLYALYPFKYLGIILFDVPDITALQEIVDTYHQYDGPGLFFQGVMKAVKQTVRCVAGDACIVVPAESGPVVKGGEAVSEKDEIRLF